MLHRHTLGKLPSKPHIAFYEDGKLLMEQMVVGDHCPTVQLAVQRNNLIVRQCGHSAVLE